MGSIFLPPFPGPEKGPTVWDSFATHFPVHLARAFSLAQVRTRSIAAHDLSRLVRD